MEIRILSLDEIPAAAELAQGVFGFDLRRTITDQSLVRSFDEYANTENLTKMVSEGRLHMWGAFEGGNMCGISAMQPEGHITMLYVYPFFRKRGYGKQLLLTMRRFARDRYKLDKVTVCAMPSWTTNYFIRNSFFVLASRPHPEFVNLEAKTLQEVIYPVKPIRGRTLAALILGTIALILIASIGFLSFYMSGI